MNEISAYKDTTFDEWLPDITKKMETFT